MSAFEDVFANGKFNFEDVFAHDKFNSDALGKHLDYNNPKHVAERFPDAGTQAEKTLATTKRIFAYCYIIRGLCKKQ